MISISDFQDTADARPIAKLELHEAICRFYAIRFLANSLMYQRSKAAGIYIYMPFRCSALGAAKCRFLLRERAPAHDHSLSD